MSKLSVQMRRSQRLAADIAEVEHSIRRCASTLVARQRELAAAGLPEVDPDTRITDRTVARYRQLLGQYQTRLAHLKRKAQQR